ncbi:MAG: hypothetical protein KKF00_01995 [Proteobacteria bacterium]|nr:hypothetical protein [Pseudomonadota bacterium]
MKQSATIQIDKLPDGAKKELVEFYDYLLHKYSAKTDARKATSVKKIPGLKTAQKAFFKKIESFSFNLPKDYQFDRDSLYER